MRGYTNKKLWVRIHNYKKKGTTCDLAKGSINSSESNVGKIFPNGAGNKIIGISLHVHGSRRAFPAKV